MKINGYEMAYSEAELDKMINEQTRQVNLIGKDFEGYKALSEGDKKALEHLVNAGRIMDSVAMEQDHPLNRAMKKTLEEAAKTDSQAAKTLFIFKTFSGLAAFNGIDLEPVELFKGISIYKGRNFYPTDMSVEEFHKILVKMLQEGKDKEVKNILSARTMVRRKGAELEGIDYTEYFAKEFSAIANELEVAAHYATNPLFKEYLGWQAQAFLQNNEDMDMLADKHWAEMQDTELEFTVGRENYDDEMTPTVCENAELSALLEEKGIEPVSKDMVGIRVGIVNKQGTDLILKFKEHMKELAEKMPYNGQYHQSVADGEGIKQTMVDVDLVSLNGDYAQCHGFITTAQNLPNNDKLSIKTGGGRRNVYHRQVRQSVDENKVRQLMDALIEKSFHRYNSPDALHLFVIGHENGHSLGPAAEYQNALGLYKHTIEETKADVVSIAFMPEYVKMGVISEEDLKQVYTSWIVRMLPKARPLEPHRVGDLIQLNYLLEHQGVSFNDENKLVIHFDKLNEIMQQLLEEIISLQLSKSPEKAKAFIDRYSTWGDIQQHIADVQMSLGVKPYIEIRSHF